MFGSRRRRRREAFAAGFPDEWRELCARRLRWWRYLTDDELSRLEAIALELAVDKDWEPANGFEVTDEMRAMISAQAALLTLELPFDEPFRSVRSILLHPTTVVLHGEHSQVEGIVSDDPTPVLGEAEFNGPVLLAWDQVLDDARHPGSGHNVVFHEFAHQLDMLDGTTDGTPPLGSAEEYDRWVEVCTRVFGEVEEGRGGPSLDDYAGVNPAEFFVVATETFFDDPVGLEEDHPDLYGCLADFYGQDPAGWPDR